MEFFLGFIGGLLIGVITGIGYMCLCRAADRRDEQDIYKQFDRNDFDINDYLDDESEAQNG